MEPNLDAPSLVTSVDQPLEVEREGDKQGDKRIRKLTGIAQQNFEEKCVTFSDKVRHAWSQVEVELRVIDLLSGDSSLEDWKKFQRNVCLIYGEYRLVAREFRSYLERTRTEDSLQYLKKHDTLDQERDRCVTKLLNDADAKIENLQMEIRSSSRSSRSRSSSRTSTLALQAKAKARAAMARLTLIDKEKTLKKQQVDIEGDLEALKEQTLYEEAKAQFEVYEEETITEFGVSKHSDSDNSHSVRQRSQPKKCSVPEEVQDTRERTRDYVASLPAHYTESVTSKKHSLNPEAKEFMQETAGSGVTFELSRFLLRKDLLFSRLTKFDDKPENYSVWKATFISVTQELGVTCREELDLLVKWLGPDSMKYALSSRASSSSNPEKGVRKLWGRLDERFGSPEIVESSLRKKIENFPRLGIRDTKHLFELADILDEVQNNMEDPKYRDLLSHYNTSLGVIPIVNKLPHGMQEKWTTRAARYKRDHNVAFPPFSFFTEFIHEMSKMKNDPGFMYDMRTSNPAQLHKKVSSMKTEIYSYPEDVSANSNASVQVATDRMTSEDYNSSKTDYFCLFHNVVGHTLTSCRSFRNKPLSVRRKFIRDKDVCYKCCECNDHQAKNCSKVMTCNECAGSHATALHVNIQSTSQPNGGENYQTSEFVEKKNEIRTACAQLCGNAAGGKSCAKIVCVHVYPKDRPEEKVKMYAMLDDQSNRSLVKPEFFDIFPGQFDEVPYSLSSCAGTIDTCGRRATGFIVENLDGTRLHELPALTECSEIPDVKDEIPTPDVAMAHSHLTDIATSIPEFDKRVPLLLLIGRDLTEAHHILKQRLGPRGHPFAQEFSLGWVIIGETCLGKVHVPHKVCVNKTYIHQQNKVSIFIPCENRFFLKDRQNLVDRYSQDVFTRTKDDDKLGLSVEDEQFLSVMNDSFTKSQDGHWSAPLPFRDGRPQLPNNKEHALKRAHLLKRSLRKNPEKQKHFIEFMNRIFENGYAEPAPPLHTKEECWYIPIFGVYHAKKRDQIRVVFDSSAQYEGVSLNSVLLQGPDLMNNLIGVLMRFRRQPVAVTADIQQMFFQFRVHEEHRNYLRFIWFKDNDPKSELTEYRMCSHVFGNSPSLSIAAYGLYKTAVVMESVYGRDVRDFVENNFYVDDGVSSFPDAVTAIDVLTRTQKALLEGGNLRLHKIASNDSDVMKAFPKSDLAKDLQNISIGTENLPTQRSLGMSWNLQTDSFTYTVAAEEKPLTRRGLLSTVNSLYDPLGFVAPVVIQGKLLLRELVQETIGWDDPLPAARSKEWDEWKHTLTELEKLRVPRTYLPVSTTDAQNEIHVFSDASEKAISAVAYVKGVNTNGSSDVGFIFGKAKVSPQAGHTIPRLELCAAVMAVELGETVSEQLGVPIRLMKFYTDSRVVLGYLNNKVRRFYMYVQNRVCRILKSTTREQWFYVPTEDNPADEGTRPVRADLLQSSKWLNGPDFLSSSEPQLSPEVHELQSPDDDKEIRPSVQCMKTVSRPTQQFELGLLKGAKNWRCLVRVIALLKTKARTLKAIDGNVSAASKRDIFVESERFLLKQVQIESFSSEIECLAASRTCPKNSAIIALNPFLDEYGILRVGGRLRNASGLSTNEMHPVILPKRHFVSKLVILHYHETVCHQGCHLTEGAVRSGGFWIVGVKRLVRSIIGNCFKCKRLRGKMGSQIMADLPMDRLTPGPPFSSVGVDVFGPWNVVARRTRGGLSHSKRWAVLYTCLTTRAIHIEVIEELSTSSFINATRRFIAIRGPVRVFRSDRGTNFVGATDCMKISAINVEDRALKNLMDTNQTVWIFNSPHSSHMGGVWERLIGVVRRILESMFADISRNLTHELLTTFMAEVCSIVNSRPLVPVSTDPDNPVVLSPVMILTQKPAEEGQQFTEISMKDMYKAQWRRVQCLSDMFWRRWKAEFLQTLQQRKKWTSVEKDFRIGDVVLVNEGDSPRNTWPVGIITELFQSRDGYVRKVMVRLNRDGDSGPRSYVRPIIKLVRLIESEDICN